MKYGNKKTVVGGISFDSKAEARRYQDLKWLERAGEIKGLKLQPEYELIPPFRKAGHSYRHTVYRADFEYYDVKKGRVIVEDTKGFKTDVYRLKKKLFEYKYPDLQIMETK